MRHITEPCELDDGIVPAGYGPFLPISEQDVAAFNDAFSDEIDSSFASSVCCCDHCYDEFRSRWPDIAFRQMEFQTQSMDATWAVDYSRLPGVYSAAEISTLRHLVSCPRCDVIGANNIWVYEHRFRGARRIEVAIDELLTLGKSTPFLILEHEFAQRVLATVRSQSRHTSPKEVLSVYRARLKEDVLRHGQAPGELSTYGPPPAEHVGEGRFNHAGSPMLYMATSKEIAAAELGRPGEPIFVGKLNIKRPLLILDLFDLEEGGSQDELLQALASSALLSAPRTGQGWEKRQYVFSRFVADCARSAGFDAIRYGSTKALDGSNYVVLEPANRLDLFASLDDHEEMICPAAARRY